MMLFAGAAYAWNTDFLNVTGSPQVMTTSAKVVIVVGRAAKPSLTAKPVARCYGPPAPTTTPTSPPCLPCFFVVLEGGAPGALFFIQTFFCDCLPIACHNDALHS